ncbi:acetylornithine transaminase [Alkalihalobacillus sp. LMS39]|uniref:acetylornithine transaminase n=1 Tax=Alkalihalobacillus sp. LMS39 TaxID=2924032 RepID=UPI001FB2B493|nr:acetylornithine transaminase [Alkalihalobacillus sp. LMS39]UOE93204.1 acetylornithine transaminase [Alkalihalobacillus sp. LMS39]
MSAIFPTYARWEIEVESGKGTVLKATDGKEYLDFTSGIAVCNLGHCHEAVVEAVKEQAEKLWHVSNLFHIPLQEEVAETLVQHSDGQYVFFCNSGAEANEAAIKLARKYTGKTKILTFAQSFHGRTFGSMSATGQAKIHDGYGPLLNEFQYLPYNDIQSVKKAIDDNVAAIMLEVIQGEGGVHIGDRTFIQEIEALCQEHDILLMIDEVQTGIGRTGKPFAYQHYGISPDIVTVAKGLGNGFPVGAMIGKEKLKEAFSPGSHGSTFGGNPLAMAAAKATLNTIFTDDFLTNVTTLGEYFMQQLTTIFADSSLVKEVRGKGLMIGIECTENVTEILKKLREQQVLILNAGPNVIRLLPPLTVTKAEIDLVIEKIKENYCITI